MDTLPRWRRIQGDGSVEACFFKAEHPKAFYRATTVRSPWSGEPSRQNRVDAACLADPCSLLAPFNALRP
jgi:hypothetical protein